MAYHRNYLADSKKNIIRDPLASLDAILDQGLAGRSSSLGSKFHYIYATQLRKLKSNEGPDPAVQTARACKASRNKHA